MRLVKLVNTCTACPSQWEGKLDDGTPVYIRKRWGWCSVCVGTKEGGMDSAVMGNEVLGWNGDDAMDGFLSDEELIAELILRDWEVDLS